MNEHFVQFYQNDTFLIDEVAGFIGNGLSAGDAGIVIATHPHRVDLERRLRLPSGRERATPPYPGAYIALDAAETLAKFMIDGWPDEQRFSDTIGPLIRQAATRGNGRVRAFGEMVALLWAETKHEAAVHLEALWNKLAQTHSFSLMCAYPMHGFCQEQHGTPFLRICDAHSHVTPAESYARPRNFDQLNRQIVQLQQKASALTAEVTKRREIEKTLQRRERELSNFLENAAQGMHRISRYGTILWANRAELALLGYTPEEYVGHDITEFHTERDGIDDMLQRLRRGETLHDRPAKLRCKDGSVKHVLLHANALIEHGELVHANCFTRDVTDSVRLEEERQLRLEELAAADRRKNEFLAMLGHELRNPLAPIVTALELMRCHGGDPARSARSREIIERQVALLTRLVNDLLDVSRVTRGRIELKTETTALNHIVEQALELTRPLIQERRHALTLDIPAEPLWLTGDGARLAQTLANLLQNAAKYTNRDGHIRLYARYEGGDVVLGVQDSGIGLTPDQRVHVFDLFVQGRHSPVDAPSGLGIGLTLARTIAQMHGGSIEAHSEGPGCGSEFVLRLPLAAVQPSLIAAVAS